MRLKSGWWEGKSSPTGAVRNTRRSQLSSAGDWTGRQYDFNWCIDHVPKALRLYREHQQDARQYTFQGLVGRHGWERERTDRQHGSWLRAR